MAHINDAGRRLRVVDRSLEEEAARRTACVEVQEGRVTLSKQALAEAPDAVKPRMLLRLFDLLGVGRRDITAAHLNAILYLTRNTLWGRESRLDLPHGVTARYCREWLILPETHGGGRSVKRLCLDRRISLTERDRLPAIYAGGCLAAVWRLGVDEAFSVSAGEPCRFIQIAEAAKERDHEK